MKKLFLMLMMSATALEAQAGGTCYSHFQDASARRDHLRGVLIVAPLLVGSVGLLKHDNMQYKQGLLGAYALGAIAADVLPENRYRKVVHAYENSVSRDLNTIIIEDLTRSVNEVFEKKQLPLQANRQEVAALMVHQMESGKYCRRTSYGYSEDRYALYDISAVALAIAEAYAEANGMVVAP